MLGAGFTWDILPVDMQTYCLSDFDYHLPPDLIAQEPAAERTGSRLLVVPPKPDALSDRLFTNLPDLLKVGDLLVFNDSRVIRARLYGLKKTGGAVEILVERVISKTRAQAMLRASKKPGTGASIYLVKRSEMDGLTGTNTSNERHPVTLVGRDPAYDDRFIIDFNEPVFEVLSRFGELPLPPYIAHPPSQQDYVRYQTVYAQYPGSVAAPTAGLHFDEPMLDKLANRGVQTTCVTLHVGSGTFSPVRSDDLSQHQMHSEWCTISPESAKQIAQAKREGRRVIAVGTTSLRTLESAATRRQLAGEWETNLFITPGYQFGLVDALITNFHLPKSTLLMLVSAFAGYDRIRDAYAHAVEKRYRFFSYGDAMLLSRD